MENTKISIIVPIYNVGIYLENCITSIISQNYENIEIILVNDGSTDSSGKICRKYAEKDDRIILVEQENRGLVHARKIGIEHATGEYIGFVDGDDYIEPDMYEKLYHIINTTDIDIVHSGWIEDSIIKLPEQFIVEGDISKNVEQYILKPQAEYKITPSIWSKLFRGDLIRKCYEDVPDYQSFGEDWIVLVYCICEGARIGSVKEAYYHYTLRMESLSHVNSMDNYRAVLGFCETIKKALISYELYDDLKEQVAEFYNNQVIDALKKNIKDKFSVQRFRISEISQYEGKRIILYGAGEVGMDYYSQLSRYSECEIVAWVDKKYRRYCYKQCRVEPVERIFEIEYDYIIIANNNKSNGESIKVNLVDNGIDINKIIWISPGLNG